VSGARDGLRLQKLIAEAGIASRRKAEEMIDAGRVSVNGKVVRTQGVRVDPERDKVEVDGRRIEQERKVYYLLHKPDGVVCSAEPHTDDQGRTTVRSLMSGVRERIYPVGRLDYHTRGLLLMTNDGALSDALTHPRGKVEKVYHVKFQGILTPEALKTLKEGVVLEDGVKTLPATEAFAIRTTETNTWVQLGIVQGLNRQIRRMGDAIDFPVLKLIRVSIDCLGTEGLGEGQFRALTQTEVESLRAHIARVAAVRPGRRR
jgi:23S rRNA pseudouridine2605 synthase